MADNWIKEETKGEPGCTTRPIAQGFMVSVARFPVRCVLLDSIVLRNLITHHLLFFNDAYRFVNKHPTESTEGGCTLAMDRLVVGSLCAR
jgi:hypothetical protein